MSQSLIPRLRQARVIPVVRTSSAALAARAVEWLRASGLTVFEITMTVPDAPALIRDLASDPALLVGAGTVPDRAAAEACLAAGARFLVCPWVDPVVAQAAHNHVVAEAAHGAGAIAMLGAMTPTEVRAAIAGGADVVKIFPASSAGGPAHVKALRAVFPDTVFCPTGGVDSRNAPDYLAAGAAFVGIGGRLVDEGLLARGDRAGIEAAARDVLGLIQV
ncbi:bifunctional 4-hydroxy-2-oxoglutarate aldolase/2-dehydro-3-deoxy-phosphogluconate aldolase [Falsiroseomonas sp.]|jgi:2-dehydro-3-deoxyphosphogluconate aldolase/(4S)-4-hydroxy-2-oxoglutarate aldolase|uniref:bifunctional 4-hydroxy-2-oxoglutarate aldolase/2-dehydro-3-deoxy-phosphogluconate aldolase n=1 Tax=Falsiroseomonas sp. TaxID=2870721 RepID=UPI003F6E6011